MFFTVLPVKTRFPASARSTAFLITDNWDDWFKFNTLYSLTYFDAGGVQPNLGEVKVGQFKMAKDQRRPLGVTQGV